MQSKGKVVPECRICGGTHGNTEYTIKEMMFGTREEFRYFQCDTCGCLQILEIPEDLSRFYPSDYFSFTLTPQKYLKAKNYIYSRRFVFEMGYGGCLGALFSLLAKPISFVPWLKIAGVSVNAKILDVGCGSGKLLRKMALGGMQNLVGVDPFLDDSINYQDNLVIHNCELGNSPNDWQGTFDLVMFHHSFEHMDNPKLRLHEAERLLNKRGVILIRLPVADSYAWRNYRENWFGIDAPRHLFLHTSKSIQLLCESLGMEIFKFESTGEISQFITSELYSQGVALCDAKLGGRRHSQKQLKQYREMTRELNLSEDGDQATFFIRRKCDDEIPENSSDC